MHVSDYEGSFSLGFFFIIDAENQSATSIQREGLPPGFPSIRPNFSSGLNRPCDDSNRTVYNTGKPRFCFDDGLASSIRRRRRRDTDAVVQFQRAARISSQSDDIWGIYFSNHFIRAIARGPAARNCSVAYCKSPFSIRTSSRFFLNNFGRTDRSHFLIPRFSCLPSPVGVENINPTLRLDEIRAQTPLYLLNALSFAQRLIDGWSIKSHLRLPHIRARGFRLLDPAIRQV
jgi:hypothetical protein